jgi:hypothetical protein
MSTGTVDFVTRNELREEIQILDKEIRMYDLAGSYRAVTYLESRIARLEQIVVNLLTLIPDDKKRYEAALSSSMRTTNIKNLSGQPFDPFAESKAFSGDDMDPDVRETVSVLPKGAGARAQFARRPTKRNN